MQMRIFWPLRLVPVCVTWGTILTQMRAIANSVILRAHPAQLALQQTVSAVILWLPSAQALLALATATRDTMRIQPRHRALYVQEPV